MMTDWNPDIEAAPRDVYVLGYAAHVGMPIVGRVIFPKSKRRYRLDHDAQMLALMRGEEVPPPYKRCYNFKAFSPRIEEYEITHWMPLPEPPH